MFAQALTGIKVLDLSWYVAGPYCTKLLADCGAEVTKVEKPGEGDRARTMGPFFKDQVDPEKSIPFFYLNTNKRSVTLNLKSAAGKDILKKLVKESDVLVENFSPGTMDRMGLGYDELKKVNPGLIMTSITNFGQTGPYRDFKANDINFHAIAAWMYSVGEPGREPLRMNSLVTLYVAGVNAANGTLAAVLHKERKGTGQHFDVSIMECWLQNQRYIATVCGLGAAEARKGARKGNPFPGTTESGIAECKDGYVGINCLTPAQWEAACLMLGAPEITRDPRFASPQSRMAHRTELMEVFKPHLDKLKARTADDIFYAAHELRVPAGLVYSVDQILTSKQHQAREYFVTADTSDGPVTFPGAPFKLSETPWQFKHAAPRLGENNTEVYGRMGYDEPELGRLREQDVI